MMTDLDLDLARKCKLPAEVMAFVNDGFLAVAEEDADRATVEFRMPLLGSGLGGSLYPLQPRLDRSGPKCGILPLLFRETGRHAQLLCPHRHRAFPG